MKKIIKLEAIRGFASLYVVLHHISNMYDLKPLLPSFVRLPFRFGQEAVILFFLLSGFVIALSFNRTALSFSQYFRKRLLRIFPLFIISVILSTSIYLINKKTFTSRDLYDLFGNFLMLQDIPNKPGLLFRTYLNNQPLWSLSYEWWFYMLFFPISSFFISKRVGFSSIYGILLISASFWLLYIIRPNHCFLVISYLVMWWSGVGLADVYRKENSISFRKLKEVFISLGIMTLLTLVPIILDIINRNYIFDQTHYPTLIFRHFFSALLFLFISVIWKNNNSIILNKLINPFAKIAPFSYGLYITHFPILLLEITGINIFLEYTIKLILCFIIAYISEIHIHPFVISFFKKNKSNVIQMETIINS